jgi:hypothetical protein
MPTILDNAVQIGKESAYGTAVTPTRAYEAKADTWKRNQEYLDSTGIRAGLQAQRSDRSRAINMGGEGAIEADVLSTGFGLIFQSLLGTTAGPTQQAATAAYLSTFTSAADDPNTSWTVQVLRTDVGGTTRAFTHAGCVITGWSLGHEVGGLLSASFNFDFQNVVTSTAAAVPAYPASGLPFDWTQCSATWDGNAIDIKSFSLDADLAMNTDRRFLRGNALKKQPIRSGVPTFEGTIETEFESLTHYNAFVAGTVAPLVVKWTGANIASTHDFEVTLTMNAVQFTGESPEVAMDDLPSQNLPFKALWNGTNAACQLTYKSTDTAL